MTRSLSLASLSFIACLALALPAVAVEELREAPQGPGSIFQSVEAAAIDGLAFAHKTQLESVNKLISRGGAVVAVSGGYTYGALDEARPADPNRIPLRMPRHAVAHFHTYPAQNSSTDWRNESHSKADRALVDLRDAQHRPSFVLTPSLRVVAYRGAAANKSVTARNAETEVADLAASVAVQRVASTN